MLSIGIVGPPNVGKSTLFEALTKKQVDRENYPFCTIDPNVGVVKVPDSNLKKLGKALGFQETIPSAVEFVDIAGLIKGAHQGEGLGNQFLSQIKEVDALIIVLRLFKAKDVSNPQEKIDPIYEKEILETEMQLKDEEWEDTVLEKKPRLYVLNGSSQNLNQKTRLFFEKQKGLFLVFDVLQELEAANLSSQERKDLGLNKKSALDSLIKKSYNLLNLITFYTIVKAGEVRAWPIEKGSTAPQAGGLVHQDFEDKFIKAEVINWQKLVKTKNWLKAREKGLIRAEGHDYVVQDGDVVKFKI